MTQEDKELLLIDLSARLPYKVNIHIETDNEVWNDYLDTISICKDQYDNQITYINRSVILEKCICKPYLRPMSSMTEEECDKVEEIIGNDCIFDFMSNGDIVLHKGHFTQKTLSALYDFYNSIHVDCNTDDQGKTMIEKGIALKAPDGMYK